MQSIEKQLDMYSTARPIVSISTLPTRFLDRGNYEASKLEVPIPLDA